MTKHWGFVKMPIGMAVTCQCVHATWGLGILQSRRAMCGISALSLIVNSLMTKGSQLAYRHRSDRGREGGMAVEGCP